MSKTTTFKARVVFWITTILFLLFAPRAYALTIVNPDVVYEGTYDLFWYRGLDNLTGMTYQLQLDYIDFMNSNMVGGINTWRMATYQEVEPELGWGVIQPLNLADPSFDLSDYFSPTYVGEFKSWSGRTGSGGSDYRYYVSVFEGFQPELVYGVTSETIGDVTSTQTMGAWICSDSPPPEVPEPSTIISVALGMIGVMYIKKRRKTAT